MDDAVRPGSLDAVLWDLDGTLIDSEPLHEWTFEEALKGLGIAVPADFHDHILGKSEPQCYRWLVAEMGLTLDYDAWVERRIAYYMDNLDRLTPIAPSLALWQDFARRGIAQAVVSNSDRLVVDTNIKALGLDPASVPSVSRSDVTEGKPSPSPISSAPRGSAWRPPAPPWWRTHRRARPRASRRG